MDFPPDAPLRIVRPRKPANTWRYIIALADGQLLLERTGETLPDTELPKVITRESSSIIVCQDFGPHLQRLERVLGGYARFNYRVTPKYRESRSSGHAAIDTVVNFVGFKKGENQSTEPARYHYPLDPVQFVRMSIDEVNPDPHIARIAKLLLWAQEVRDWCHDQRLQVKPSSGGLVAQLLRDPRFYPEARRKVPQLINDTARSQLPGNYYLLRGVRNREYQAIYLDLTSAHHAMAARIRFPDANTLHAFGYWTRDEYGGKLYRAGGTELLHRPGLYKLRLTIPHIPENRFPPPWAQRLGTSDAWIYSNELELVEELGITIEGVIAALVSRTHECGLNEYAKFAIAEIRANRQYKPWLKPTLHSTYGVLAAKPIAFETGFYRASGGVKTEYPMGAISIPAIARRSSKPVESRIANVIHRGMIEAEVRKEALWLARFLTEVDRRHVLAVYADSVFIRDNGEPLKLLPPPWRVAEYLTDLRFFDATHFTSRELTRMPGLPRTNRDAKALEKLIERQALVYSAHKPTRPKEGKHASRQT